MPFKLGGSKGKVENSFSIQQAIRECGRPPALGMQLFHISFFALSCSPVLPKKHWPQPDPPVGDFLQVT